MTSVTTPSGGGGKTQRRWASAVHHTSFVSGMPSDATTALPAYHSSPQLHRLIMEEDEKEGIKNEKPSMNGSISAVTVRETLGEGRVKQMTKMMLSGRRTEGWAVGRNGDNQFHNTPSSSPVIIPNPTSPNTFTTTAVLETPPHSREILEALKFIEAKKQAQGSWISEGTLESSKVQRSIPQRMVDAASSTSDLSATSIKPSGNEKDKEKEVLEELEKEEEGKNLTLPLVRDPGKDVADGSTMDKKPETFSSLKPVFEVEEKIIEKGEDNSCLVDCLYLSMQCCECTLM